MKVSWLLLGSFMRQTTVCNCEDARTRSILCELIRTCDIFASRPRRRWLSYDWFMSSSSSPVRSGRRPVPFSRRTAHTLTRLEVHDGQLTGDVRRKSEISSLMGLVAGVRGADQLPRSPSTFWWRNCSTSSGRSACRTVCYRVVASTDGRRSVTGSLYLSLKPKSKTKSPV